jgi:hypothetical protein
MPQYRRRSFSCHALKRLGYEVDHQLRVNGNGLWIKSPAGKEYLFRLITLDETDYVIVRVSLPLPTTNVSAIDLAKTMPLTSLYHLIHLRLGCPGRRAMELLLNGRSVTGLPANVPIPDAFSCPICLREKQPSLAHGPTREPPLLVLGELLHIDFGFYRIRSCRGFTCFLVVTEAVSNHRWTFCRQSKTPPIKLIQWILQLLQAQTGVAVKCIWLDGELCVCATLKTSNTRPTSCWCRTYWRLFFVSKWTRRNFYQSYRFGFTMSPIWCSTPRVHVVLLSHLCNILAQCTTSEKGFYHQMYGDLNHLLEHRA